MRRTDKGTDKENENIREGGEREKGNHFSMASKETTEEQRQVNIKSDE